MNRLSFLRNFLITAAAPGVLAEVDYSGIVKQVEQFTPIAIKKELKLCLSFKTTPELLEDENTFVTVMQRIADEYKIWNGDQTKEYKFDLSKPYRLQKGFDKDDFTKNLQTCILTQFIDK